MCMVKPKPEEIQEDLRSIQATNCHLLSKCLSLFCHHFQLDNWVDKSKRMIPRVSCTCIEVAEPFQQCRRFQWINLSGVSGMHIKILRAYYQSG